MTCNSIRREAICHLVKARSVGVARQIDPKKHGLKRYVIGVAAVGAVIVAAVSIQGLNVFKLRPASGSASAMAAAVPTNLHIEMWPGAFISA